MKSIFYFLFLMILFSLYFIGFACADEKKFDINVVVGNESNIENPDNYLSFDDFWGPGEGTVIQAEDNKESSLAERGINSKYQREFGELASSKLSDNLFFPVVLIIFAIILIIIYFFRNSFGKRGKRKKKEKMRMKSF